MHGKALWMAVMLAVVGHIAAVQADMVPTPDGIAVKSSDVPTPPRGMSMEQVASKFGAPVTKVPAVGNPPISRWEYPGFVVYFEGEHVIHAVVASTPAATAPAPTPAAAPTPASTAPAA